MQSWGEMEDYYLAILIVITAFSIEAVHLGANAQFFKRFSRVRVLFINCSLIALMLCLVALAGEIYLRFIYDETNSFGLMKTSKLWFERHYHYNQSGMRDSVSNPAKKIPGKRRVTFLGDSFTAGHGIKDVELRFANRVRHLRPDLDVQVLAKNGLDTGAEIQLLESFAAKGVEFDKVVLAYCLNDISDLIPEWTQSLDRIYHAKNPGVLFEASFLADFFLQRWLSTKEVDVRDYYHVVLTHYEGEIWQMQKMRFKILRDKITKMGGSLSVVTLPFFHNLGPDYPYRKVHARLNDAWKELGVANLDLLPIYNNRMASELTVNAFDGHPNELAHQMAADEIANFLK